MTPDEFNEAFPQPVGKKKRKAAHYPIIAELYDYKKLYSDARKIGFKRDTPAAWEAGHYFDKKCPDVSNTNGMQKYIQDVLINLGHTCERVNTMGIKTPDGWRRSGSTVGSSDLHAVLVIPSQTFGVPWKIEVKRPKEGLQPAQEKYKAKAIKANSLHTIMPVGNVDYFWNEYYKYMKL